MSTARFRFDTLNQPVEDIQISIAAVYEDFSGGLRVREALGWLERKLAPLKVVRTAWSFSMLERLDVRLAAIHDAADADLILVAAKDDQELPVQVARWIDSWMVESSKGPAALVALHDDLFGSAPLTVELARIASRWQMTFIGNSQFEDWLSGEIMERTPYKTRLRPVESAEPRAGRLAVLTGE